MVYQKYVEWYERQPLAGRREEIHLLKNDAAAGTADGRKTAFHKLTVLAGKSMHRQEAIDAIIALKQEVALHAETALWQASIIRAESIAEKPPDTLRMIFDNMERGLGMGTADERIHLIDVATKATMRAPMRSASIVFKAMDVAQPLAVRRRAAALAIPMFLEISRIIQSMNVTELEPQERRNHILLERLCAKFREAEPKAWRLLAGGVRDKNSVYTRLMASDAARRYPHPRLENVLRSAIENEKRLVEQKMPTHPETIWNLETALEKIQRIKERRS